MHPPEPLFHTPFPTGGRDGSLRGMRLRGARSGGAVACPTALAMILALLTGSLAAAGPRPVD